MSLIDFAKKELEQAGLFDKEKDFYGGMTGTSVLELIDVFAKQGHSGMSASIVRNLFNKLADYEPINPITNLESDWNEVGNNVFQHKHVSAVFKNGKNDKPYYLDGQIFKDKRSAYTNRDSRKPLNLPCYLPKHQYYWWPWQYVFRIRNFFAGI